MHIGHGTKTVITATLSLICPGKVKAEPCIVIGELNSIRDGYLGKLTEPDILVNSYKKVRQKYYPTSDMFIENICSKLK